MSKAKRYASKYGGSTKKVRKEVKVQKKATKKRKTNITQRVMVNAILG